MWCFLQAAYNEWMAQYNAKLYPEPDKKDVAKWKEFFRIKYVQKRYYRKEEESSDSDSDREKKKKSKKAKKEKKPRKKSESSSSEEKVQKKPKKEKKVKSDTDEEDSDAEKPQPKKVPKKEETKLTGPPKRAGTLNTPAAAISRNQEPKMKTEDKQETKKNAPKKEKLELEKVSSSNVMNLLEYDDSSKNQQTNQFN